MPLDDIDNALLDWHDQVKGKSFAVSADTQSAWRAAWIAKPLAPPAVRIALRVLLNHVEPGFDNCRTVVQAWLDGELESTPPAAPSRGKEE